MNGDERAILDRLKWIEEHVDKARRALRSGDTDLLADAGIDIADEAASLEGDIDALVGHP